ncbi:MAG: hypothetical protein GY847_39365 [Proteobacteria bacterium]|nr:hypothetical protein [Pseudomonadota bacterium]
MWIVVQTEDKPTFLPAPEQTDDDVRQIVETTAKRVIRLMERRGVLEDGDFDRLADEFPVPAGEKTAETPDEEDAAPRKYRLSWSAHLDRIFQIDMEKCPHCGENAHRSD